MRRTAAVLAALCVASPVFAAACGDAPFDRATIERDAKAEFASYDTAKRQALALALVPCLASPDPALRDGLAYTVLAWQMRKEQLETDTLLALEAALRPQLAADDPDGFAAPFAALTLASVAAADAKTPFLDPAGREQLLEAATAYVRGIRDYRGYDEREGWRHGVAHGADLLAALAANAKLGPEALGALLGAVASQVAPQGHAYVFGEPERLATAVVAVSKRGVVSDAAWAGWLDRVASPRPFDSWNAVWTSSEGLARRHDTVAFLSALELKLRAAQLYRFADEVAKRRTM